MVLCRRKILKSFYLNREKNEFGYILVLENSVRRGIEVKMDSESYFN